MTILRLSNRPELSFLTVFGLGYAASLAFPAPKIDQAPAILSSLSQPEVFVPAFLAAFILLSLFTLRDSRAKPARGTDAGKLRGGSQNRPDEQRVDSATSGNARISQLLVRTQEELEQQVQGIFSSVGEFITKNGKYSQKLDDARSELGVAATLEQVRAVVETLVEENKLASEETKILRSRLEESRSRIADMKNRLKVAEIEAITDPLTGVGNRRSLDAFIESEVRSSHAELTPLCLIMADIDHFKRINDTFGHQAGDDVLEQVAGVLKANVRTSDFVARYGGEEFTVVLPRTTTGNALSVAERIRKALSAKAIYFNGQPLGHVTASFGVAAIQPSETPEDLVARADKKVYEAKLKGRNRVEFDSSSSA